MFAKKNYKITVQSETLDPLFSIDNSLNYYIITILTILLEHGLSEHGLSEFLGFQRKGVLFFSEYTVVMCVTRKQILT